VPPFTAYLAAGRSSARYSFDERGKHPRRRRGRGRSTPIQMPYRTAPSMRQRCRHREPPILRHASRGRATSWSNSKFV